VRPAWSLRRHRGVGQPPGRRVCRRRNAAPARTRQLDRPRTAMSRRRIQSELRVERGSEREKRGRSGRQPVSDETAPMLARGGNRLGQLLRLQRRQITLQHNDIGEWPGHFLFGHGDGVVQWVPCPSGVGSASTLAPSAAAAALAAWSGVMTVIEPTAATPPPRSACPPTSPAPHSPGTGREHRCQSGLGGGQSLDGDDQGDISRSVAGAVGPCAAHMVILPATRVHPS